VAILQKLTGIVRRHPLTSALDISLWAFVMMTVTWLAFEYDLAMLWGEMTPREHHISVEESIALSVLYAAGLAIFVWRRPLEEKQGPHKMGQGRGRVARAADPGDGRPSHGFAKST